MKFLLYDTLSCCILEGILRYKVEIYISPAVFPKCAVESLYSFSYLKLFFSSTCLLLRRNRYF